MNQPRTQTQPMDGQAVPIRFDVSRLRATWWHARGPLGLACAALLGLGFAGWLYSLAVLNGSAPFWWRETGDTTQYLSGFNAFVREPWHWPLLRIESLNAPQGTLATFLDVVPLYALVLKLLRHGPGTPFSNPYGAWIGICFLLQGAGAWWICREAGTRRWSTLLALTLLLVSFPALTFRISHTSLMSQWLLTFGLAIYIRSTRIQRLATLPWVVLVPCAFYINIYLFAMVSALFGADILRQWGRGGWKSALAAPLLAYGLLLASMFATMLPMPPGAGGSEWGFGYYSMNLLSPLHGGMVLKFDHPTVQDGQGEGYNYLGVFVLALAWQAWRLRKRFDPAYLRRHRALLMVLAGLTLFAISDVVTLGPVQLFTLKLWGLVSPLTGTFRSSGRFFWPVGYALVVFTVIGIARHVPARRAALLLGLVTLLQLGDLKEHHARARATVAEPAPALVDVARWDAFLGRDVHALQYYPAFGCGKGPAQQSLLPTMLYATRRGYTLSTGYIARAKKSCDSMRADLAAMRRDSAVVFDKGDFPERQPVLDVLGAGAACEDMGTVYLCRRGAPAREKLENKQ